MTASRCSRAVICSASGTWRTRSNRAKNGDRVTFAANHHINPTNICMLRKTCVFCSYARLPKEDGAYRYTMEQVWAEAATANSTLTREFHIVGGLDMKAGLAYYSEMFRGLKERHPQVHIKALTAVEIAHIARIEKMTVRDTLIALREAGLDTMPGGGAEVFSPGVRATIADKKLSGEEYINVHREAHQLGIRTQLHDALRPRRDVRGSHGAPGDAARICRTRRAASSPTFRSRIIPTTTNSARRCIAQARRPRGSTISRISRSAGCSSTTSTTSSRTGSWSRRSSRSCRCTSA